MKYNIIGRWCSLHISILDKVHDNVGRAFLAYNNTNSYGHNKPIYISSYDLKCAAELLITMSPKERVDLVRVDTGDCILVTLAIQVQHLDDVWSSTGSICLEELIDVLYEKDPTYHALFLSKVLGVA